ncbi:Peptide deformylase 1B, chloroplastic [Triticum urartu]|uniref:Peptide deformylase n=1 Tax=Triticum urartu TaxID=4572 RepID=M7ZCR5_TRIUA|nr:Peptide deformylase 1B, chloroplastic [Triticum urartu]
MVHALGKEQSQAVRALIGRPYKEEKDDADYISDNSRTADLRFEPPLKVVQYPDPVLRARNKRINTFDDNLRSLADEMFDVMYKTDGIGLSAPQVGVNVQLMVFNPAGVEGEGEEIVLVNPVVYKFSKRLSVYEEGCLSFPGIYANVLRPDTVKIDAQDASGAKIKVKLSELSARVFQHEFDHLQGILFFDRMTMDVVESIHEQLKVLQTFQVHHQAELQIQVFVELFVGAYTAVILVLAVLLCLVMYNINEIVHRNFTIYE